MIATLHKDRTEPFGIPSPPAALCEAMRAGLPGGTGSSASRPVCVKDIFISDGHNFFGHHGKPVGTHAIRSVDHVECVKGRGLRGDRFFDYKESYKGQITFFSQEVFDDLVDAVGARGKGPGALRRNILVEGLDLNALIGHRFELQGIAFEGAEECRPCYWMDTAIAPGAEDFLKGRGGLRARILSDGWLIRG